MGEKDGEGRGELESVEGGDDGEEIWCERIRGGKNERMGEEPELAEVEKAGGKRKKEARHARATEMRRRNDRREAAVVDGWNVLCKAR